MTSGPTEQVNVRIKGSLHAYVKDCVYRYNNWVRASRTAPRLTESRLIELGIELVKAMGIDFEDEMPFEDVSREVLATVRSLRKKR